jgi:hypothetical protein
MSDAELYHVDLIAWINTAAAVEPWHYHSRLALNHSRQIANSLLLGNLD